MMACGSSGAAGGARAALIGGGKLLLGGEIIKDTTQGPCSSLGSTPILLFH